MCEVLGLNEREEVRFYELAAKTKPEVAVAQDLVEYLTISELAKEALRVAKNAKVTDETCLKNSACKKHFFVV